MDDEEMINFAYCDLIYYKEEEKEINSSLCDINTNKNDNSKDEQTLSQNLQSSNLTKNNLFQSFEENYLINNNIKDRKKHIFQIFKKKNSKIRKTKKIISLDGIFIPKVKHLNVEKKKNRVQYQENHRKIIYSYCHLTPPYDFEYIFRIIIEHQNQHNKIFNDKKSFHLIRNKNGNIIIVTFQEKQKIRKNSKSY